FQFLLHFCLSVSYFFINYIFSFVATIPEEVIAKSLIVSFILFISELNPFSKSELSDFFNEVQEDDNLIKVKSYSSKNSIISWNHPTSSLSDKIFKICCAIGVLWGALVLILGSFFIKENFLFIYETLLKGSFIEKLVMAFWILVFLILVVLIVYQIVYSFYALVISPLSLFIKRHLFKRTSLSVKGSDLKHLRHLLKELPLFSYFNDELLDVFIEKGRLKKFKPNERVLIQGDKSEDIFVLIDGVLQVRKNYGSGEFSNVGEIFPVAVFGENALLEKSPRAADVICVKPSIVLAIPAELVRKLSEETQFIREIENFKNVIMVNQFFSSAPIFRELPAEVIHLFLTRGKIETLPPQKVVIRQGSFGDEFYLIIRGSVGVIINKKMVNKIRQGGFFGEISLIADVPRTATVMTLEKTILLKISSDTFWQILSQNISVAMFIEYVGKLRVQDDIERIRSSV
ncbi:MAG: cyclic nucleotide-binding domain-containing protein, partial [Bdellovibrio sp.]